MERGVDVLIATPGRLLDVFERGPPVAQRHPDPGHRRGRPNARHGFHPRRRTHRKDRVADPPDTFVLGDDAEGGSGASPTPSCLIRKRFRSALPLRPPKRCVSSSSWSRRGGARSASRRNNGTPCAFCCVVRPYATPWCSVIASETSRRFAGRCNGTDSMPASCTETCSSRRAWKPLMRSKRVTSICWSAAMSRREG